MSCKGHLSVQIPEGFLHFTQPGAPGSVCEPWVLGATFLPGLCSLVSIRWSPVLWYLMSISHDISTTIRLLVQGCGVLGVHLGPVLLTKPKARDRGSRDAVLASVPSKFPLTIGLFNSTLSQKLRSPTCLATGGRFCRHRSLTTESCLAHVTPN